MIEAIIITAVIVFLITAKWQQLAEKKKLHVFAIFLFGLTNDMNRMAVKLDYSDVFEYLSAEKGVEYSKRAKQNLTATFSALHRDDLMREAFSK